MKKFKTLAITAAAIIFWTVLLLTGALQTTDHKFYDFMLNFKKAPAESKNLLLVEADNIALEHIGPWPWKRDVYADMLLRMKELGAKTAVFDIEYLSPSNFPECDQYFSRVIQFFGNTYLTINTKELDIEYSNDDIDYANSRFLFDTAGKTSDILFGNRITSYETVHDTTRGFSKIDWNDKKSFEDLAMGFSPAMNLFVSHATGAGFTNIVIDKDGVRRRVELLSYQESLNKSAAQLVLSPLLAQLKPDSIIRTKNSLILKGAHLSNPKSQSSSDQITKDIKIPLDPYGRMLINWNHAKYKDAFRAESILFLNTMDRIEENIYAVLQNLVIEFEDWSKEKYDAEVAKDYQKKAVLLCQNYSEILEFKEFLLSICDGYDTESNAINGGIPQEYYDQYFSLRKQYFNDVTFFSNLNQLSALIKPEELQQTWDTLTHEINLYNDMFNEKSKIYKDAFCIIGQTASSTTDLGITPFERAYPNIGTHANVYNTIINQDFITPLNSLWGILFAAILTLCMTYFTEKKRPLIQNLAGVITILITVLIPIALIALSGLYLPSATPVLIALTSYIGITILRFTTAEKGRRFLKTTFGAYVAPAIVDQIVKNPELANLGGKSEYLTALFSDVKTFSGFTEVINNEAGEEKGAERLVEILNEYLGALSNAIMDQNGTIDKYVGDEIVSFFGAPVQSKNNAFDACCAAINMLKAEKDFNLRNKDKLPLNPKTGEPFYLHSRVGLNTGTMVVGNMGTEKKLNYTIMGNNVNLASRLEGTNKVYGSWIMCSESTWNMADSGDYKGKLVARKFDNVRVINVKKPVGIYNILGFRNELPEEQIKAAEIFNQGIELYLKGSDTPDAQKDISELKEARALFVKADELYPEDESSKVFIQRCDDFIKNGVPQIWDGVYTMESK